MLGLRGADQAAHGRAGQVVAGEHGGNTRTREVLPQGGQGRVRCLVHVGVAAQVEHGDVGFPGRRQRHGHRVDDVEVPAGGGRRPHGARAQRLDGDHRQAGVVGGGEGDAAVDRGQPDAQGGGGAGGHGHA